MKRRTLTVGERKPLGELVDEALIANGAVYVDGKRVRDRAREVREGQVITVVVEESGRASAEASLPLTSVEVLFEDESVIAVNKPAGVLTHPSPGRVGE